MKSDLRSVVRRVADHLSAEPPWASGGAMEPMSDERLDELMPRFTFEWMVSERRDRSGGVATDRWLVTIERAELAHAAPPSPAPFLALARHGGGMALTWAVTKR